MRIPIMWLLVVVLMGTIAIGCGTRAASDGKDGIVSPEQITQLEDELRAKPSFEAAQVEYGAAVRQMADGIAALVPGMTWQLREDSWNGCGGEYVRTRAKQVYQLVVFNKPIPDDTWAQALQIVKDGAARFGATDFGVFKDQTGHHDIYLAGPDGVEFRLGTQKASTLATTSDCRMMEADGPAPSS